MSDIHNHEARTREKMMVRNIAADIKLRTRCHGLVNEGRAASAAHCNPPDLHSCMAGTSGGHQMELVFHHRHSFLSINLFRKISDGSESDTVTVLFQDFHIFKSKTGSHCTAHSGDHLVGGRVGCIYGNIAGNRLHYRQTDGIVR